MSRRSRSLTCLPLVSSKGAKTQFIFTVTLSMAYDQVVTVFYQTENGTAQAGSDYVAKSGTLTFNPGETTKTITIEVKGDKVKEADETFFIRLSNASSNAMILDDTGLGLILNDD